MNEYKEMAKYYDRLYKNKTYDEEILFVKNIINNKKTILDIGCGTGTHMKLLEEEGYIVDGLDLNKEMVEIAKEKVKGNLFVGNILNYKVNKKYDVIISMYAVFNHLNNYNEFEKAILNSYKYLNNNGIMIIDLHNGRKDGKKEDIDKNIERTMEWHFDKDKFKEYTTIIYKIDNKEFKTNHEFLIYQIDKIKEILEKNKLKYKLLENYTMNSATDNSKDIEIIIYKED